MLFHKRRQRNTIGPMLLGVSIVLIAAFGVYWYISGSELRQAERQMQALNAEREAEYLSALSAIANTEEGTDKALQQFFFKQRVPKAYKDTHVQLVQEYQALNAGKLTVTLPQLLTTYVAILERI